MSDNIDFRLIGKTDCFIESDLSFELAAPLLTIPAAGIFDQNFPHQSRRNSEKMSPVLPFKRVLPDQPQIDLMNQSRRLQSVIRALTAEIAVR